MEKVIVRVPASTSNLGPGFDCLGVALRIYNDITVLRGGSIERLPAIVDDAARLFFKRSGLRAFSFSCSIRSRVPQLRGLGSSATARLGVLHGLNELGGRPLDRMSIFHLCAQLEGHPDNAAPASFGGFTVARAGNVQRFDVSARLYFVLLIPEFEIKTTNARKVLPVKISRLAAVESCGNACAITAAFASREYEKLRGVFADQLHQPFRRKLIPALPRVIAAAEKAGALGAFLSGSGSTICAVTLPDRQPRSDGFQAVELNPRRSGDRRSLTLHADDTAVDKVAAAMQRAAKPIPTRTVIVKADNAGVKIHD